MVKITKICRDELGKSTPYISVWERCGTEFVDFNKADDAWRTVLIERLNAYSELD